MRQGVGRPASLANAGRTKTMKATSPLTGFPGSPKTSAPGFCSRGGPDPKPEGLARLETNLVENGPHSQAEECFGNQVEHSGRNAAGHEHHVGHEPTIQDLAQPQRLVRGDRQRFGHGPRFPREPHQAVTAFELRIWPGPTGLAGLDKFVAGRHDRDPRDEAPPSH